MAVQSHKGLSDVSVEFNLVDTAPVNQLSIEIEGIQYQKALRDIPGMLDKFVEGYYEVLGLLSMWADIPFTLTSQLSRLEANTPARNLLRSMSHLLDIGTHHIRVTGSDYAGTYQEVFLYRPLAAWSTHTGLSAGRAPHILYAPLIADWSGAKLSKSLKAVAPKKRRATTKPKATIPRPHPAPRVSTDVLLAIKPEHLANIISREKNHEYRKYRLKDGISRLWLYETGSGGGRSSITHIAVIPPNTRHEPGSVPTEPFGIGNEDFNAGLKESKYGYPILELYELIHPVTLNEMKTRWGMKGAPMGWQHVGSDSWKSFWDDEKRNKKLSKIF
ncbi:hypothetical protein IL306_001285 [Fusarium sp. DS 682]|nr:hypothetical protein IL306_001285 [Fusarium sp. DS 682]